MKRFLLLFLLLLSPIFVYAEEYSVKTLIPVNTKASVKTEKFDYNNFVLNNNIISFESIKNNTISKVPVSINILLFDGNEKNIGFITYCSDKDLDSDYSGYKLLGNGSNAFSIKIANKYFVEGKSISDIKYISVLDENVYCHIGGYDKYKGLTLDEIVNGTSNKKEEVSINSFINKLKENNLMDIITLVLVGIIVLVVIIMIISSIRKKNKFKVKKVSEDVPLEKTVQLSYGEVDENELEFDSSVSMGDVGEVKEEKEENNDKDEEDGSDLTKFFN